MNEAVQHLLHIRAIEPVPLDQRGQGFYSILFVVTKASGEWRAILDLKGLNFHLAYHKFKMQMLRSILRSIRKGDLLTSIDLTKAYLHIPISLAHRRFLRFTYKGRHFQHRALRFGLSSAPRVFTKILAVLAAHLRMRSVRVQCYPDDILIQSSSTGSALSDLELVVKLLQDHGFSVNFPKSHLVPTTRLLHLGAIIDTVECRVYLSQERRNSIRESVLQLRRCQSVTLASLSQLLGKMTSAIAIVPWSRLHSRELQWFMLPFQRQNLSASQQRVRLPQQVLRFPHVVAITSHTQRVMLQGAGQDSTHDRHQPVQLESTPSVAVDIGTLVHLRSPALHKLARTTSHPSSLPSLSRPRAGRSPLFPRSSFVTLLSHWDIIFYSAHSLKGLLTPELPPCTGTLRGNYHRSYGLLPSHPSSP
ncbi:protein FAM117A isoform X2 [Crotalus tigris]|uniref:protein FAM117A isoform X2 n=1 Tax=Crotalus tigris TaxID=88082 RepID=UPI00192F63C8|nr:protein FAM117A isoform X2 [Crotalus tigris]